MRQVRPTDDDDDDGDDDGARLVRVYFWFHIIHIQTWSSLMSLSIGFSLMTAFVLICLARSAYRSVDRVSS